MVKDFQLPIEIVTGPLARESDGLAMSSRNVRLSPTGRKSALIISKALMAAAAEQSLTAAQKTLRQVLSEDAGFTLDYAEIINEADFEVASESTKSPRALVAGWVDGVRLIDNMKMNFGETA